MSATLRLAFAGVACLLGSYAAYGAELDVPGTYPTIQSAVDAAVSGDEIVLAAGRYEGAGNAGIVVTGLSLTFRSESGPEATVIDGGGQSEAQWAFIIRPGTGNQVTLEGIGFEELRARNGSAIRAEGSGSLRVDQCRFVDCGSPPGDQDSGGAIVVGDDVAATFTGCLLFGNDALGGAAALLAASAGPFRAEGCLFENNNYGCLEFGPRSASVVVESCIFRNNIAAIRSPEGAYPRIAHTTIIDNVGGLAADGDMSVTNCTITRNVRNGGGGGIWAGTHASVTVENSIIQGNCAYDIQTFGAGTVSLSCCAVDSAGIFGWEHIFFEDEQVWANPMFCDPEPCGGYNDGSLDHYLLNVDSPCAAWRSPCGETIGSLEVGCGTTELGACCVDLTCFLAPLEACEGAGGDFRGVGTICEPDTCEVTPVVPVSWGAVKRMFR